MLVLYPKLIVFFEVLRAVMVDLVLLVLFAGLALVDLVLMIGLELLGVGCGVVAVGLLASHCLNGLIMKL